MKLRIKPFKPRWHYLYLFVPVGCGIFKMGISYHLINRMAAISKYEHEVDLTKCCYFYFARAGEAEHYETQIQSVYSDYRRRHPYGTNLNGPSEWYSMECYDNVHSELVRTLREESLPLLPMLSELPDAHPAQRMKWSRADRVAYMASIGIDLKEREQRMDVQNLHDRISIRHSYLNLEL